MDVGDCAKKRTRRKVVYRQAWGTMLIIYVNAKLDTATIPWPHSRTIQNLTKCGVNGDAASDLS